MASAAHPFALLRALPALDVPHVALGEYPTQVQPLRALGDVWLKREDAASPVYGGNKLRTLETLLGDAVACGARKLWTLGSYGSNQAIAVILHARKIGLPAGVVLFPQRATPTAAENLLSAISHADTLHCLRSIATFPLHWLKRRRAHPGEYLIVPGGAVPLGALGHVGAALEIAEQVQAGAMPAPAHIMLPVGSTCTTAGLLAGFSLARELGMWPWKLPLVHAVRVTPWPVTARFRILGLARATARDITRRGGPAVPVIANMLRLHARYFGWGYGRVTSAGLTAAARFEALAAPPLDTTYSAKSGAALLDLASLLDGPKLFWCTKSSAPLPEIDSRILAAVPAFISNWLKRAAPEREAQ